MMALEDKWEFDEHLEIELPEGLPKDKKKAQEMIDDAMGRVVEVNPVPEEYVDFVLGEESGTPIEKSSLERAKDLRRTGRSGRN